MNTHAPTRVLAPWIVLATLTLMSSTAAEAGKAPGKVPRGRDTTPPTIVCPDGITAEALYASGRPVGFQVSVTDDSDPAPSFTVNPYSNSWFYIGTTPVTVTATDWRGNTATKTFNVSVVDTRPPELTCPGNLTWEATNPSGAELSLWLPAPDTTDPSPTVTFSPPLHSMLPIGTNTVTVTATDRYGNSATCSFEVTVQDSSPPAITCPNIFRAVTGPEAVTFAATVVDSVDPSPTISYSMASGSVFPIGTTPVTVTATDATGNSATRTFQVTLDDDPTDGPFAGTYALSWFMSDDSGQSILAYEWSITVLPDGTFTGSGHQTVMEVFWMYCACVDEYCGCDGGRYLDGLGGLEAFGSLSGRVTDSGYLEASGSYDYWINYYGGPFLWTSGLSFAGQASLDADGNLVLADEWGNSTTWLKQ